MVDERQQLSLAALAAMTPEELLTYLDTGWPWPLDAVQGWFEELWNNILQWLHDAVDWIEERIRPLIDQVWSWLVAIGDWIIASVKGALAVVWDWLQSVAASIVSQVSALFSQVWNWIQSISSSLLSSLSSISNLIWVWISTGFTNLWANISSYLSQLWVGLQNISATVAAKVSEINAWFSNEFIDPFIDWLVQFPGKLLEAFKNFFVDQWQLIWGFWSRDWHWLELLIGMAVVFTGGAIVLAAPAIGAAVIGATQWLGGILLSLWGAIGGWLAAFMGNLGIWIELYAGALGSWALRLLPRMGGWFMGNLIPLLGAGGIITLEATGQLNTIIGNYVTPAITSVFDWAEAIGPVSPMPGRDLSVGITKLAEFTISGLAAMTLAGEFLSPLKHIGLGHISAIIYDLINYKTLTAAFMGVLAYVYIRTPLTYYYNKAARPNIPDERSLAIMANQYVLGPDEYTENMQWHGYPDIWIEKILDTVHRPMTPYLLRSLAEAGLLEDSLLDHALHQAGYDEVSIPAIKLMMQRLATLGLQTVSTSSAMTRFKEGLDDESTLRNNLSVLGVAPELLDRFAFAANLQYLYDYQSDLIAYYKDAYHRRDIEESEFRQGLVSSGLSTERIDLAVEKERIKRLAAPKPVEPPEIAVQIDTIRDRRKKLLITRDEEISALVTLGKELPYALAIADNDDAAIAEKAVMVPPKVLPLYETEEGKIRGDTIRRLRRQRQISADEEMAALLELEVPQGLATAITENDRLRLKKETPEE